MSFYDRLLDETRSERDLFLSVPLIRRAIECGTSRDTYLAFLGQAYHHVKYTCPLLDLAQRRCGAGHAAYRAGLSSYIAEETGHERWILDDITAMGGDASLVSNGTPDIPCRAMVGYATYAIEHVSPYAMLGMVHVLEGISSQLASRAADRIAASLGVGTDSGFSYLVSHGDLDQDHVRFFRELVNGIESETGQNAIIDTANVIYRLYGDIFRDLDRREGIADAA
jgi:pyrroloquinoline quinone (PQQ) biosynthesis protein C